MRRIWIELFCNSRLNLLISMFVFTINRLKFRTIITNPFKVRWVPAGQIELVLFNRPCEQQYRIFGQVINGDWDKNALSFTDDEKFISIHQHYIDGLDWRETAIFKGRYAIKMEKNPLWGCSTLDELERYYHSRLDKLWNSICTHGYQLFGLFSAFKQSRDSAITVFIDRRGRILIGADGNHRLAICKILNLDVPIRVMAVHTEYAKNGERIV